MQRAASSGSQAKGWFTKARERFLEFEKAGMRKCAASNLRDKLRAAHSCGVPKRLVNLCRHYLANHVDATPVSSVLRRLRTAMHGRRRCLRGLPLWLTRRSWPRWQKRRRPRVRYHAVQVFPDGGWNAAQDLGSQPPTPHDRGHDGSEASGEDEGDESGLFSLGRRVSLVGQVWYLGLR